MNYASEDLIKEHEGILFGLKILEKMVNMVKENKKLEIKDVKDIINFFKLFADKCHHGKEEGILFPSMEKSGIQNKNGPIGQMLAEHTEGRNYISEMTESLNNDSLKVENFIHGATNYIRLLQSHIIKENTILFPLGDKKIPITEQNQLLIAFENHEEKVMGKGTHEKLHEMLHDFEKKYLQ